MSLRLPSRQPRVDDSLRRFFLHRLAALAVRLDRARTRQQRTLLAHAVFSTYLDCLDLGLEDEAGCLLDRGPDIPPSAREAQI
ncbi:MAG: hypothetical protein M3Q65_00890 [Chloroflexota bacterium]|nr:hypothetical protein [Chloroflexota bacterium]